MKKYLAVILAVVACLAIGAAPVAAQAVAINPSTVEFTPSADHLAIDLNGQPVVARYELRLYLETAPQPYTTKDLGKPSLNADGKIFITDRSMFLAGAVYNVKCVAKVAAIGPQGEGVSLPSNPFGNAAPPTPVGTVVVR